MDEEKSEKWSAKHADTMAIIGVNAAFFILLVTMWISHASRLDAVNNRIDTVITLMQQEFKNFQEEAKAFHGRLCVLEEKTKEK
jgi:hypothetical protein